MESTEGMQTIVETITAAAETQSRLVADWHRSGMEFRDSETELNAALAALPAGHVARFAGLIQVQHLANFFLWHVEDEARRTDVDDAVIAGCKQRIDRLNQRRNDLIEQVDAALVAALEPLLPPLPNDAAARYNTETVGSALDRMSIMALKVFHMDEEACRTDADAAHRAKCAEKLEILRAQRDGLLASVLELVGDYATGARRPRVTYQFKMYNDPSLNPALYKTGRGAK